MNTLLRKIILSIVETLSKSIPPSANIDKQKNAAKFIIAQLYKMPDYLRPPFFLLIFIFNFHTYLMYLKPFNKLNLSQREHVIDLWKYSSFGVAQDFIRFFYTLTIFDYSSHA